MFDREGRNAIVRRVANAACVAERIAQKVTHALMRGAAVLQADIEAL